MKNSSFKKTGNIVENSKNILQRILIIRLGAFGDVVRTIPAVDALKDKYPQSSITWLVDEGSANMIQGADCVDSVIILPRKGFMRDFTGAISALRKIRRHKFTCVFDFHGLIRSGLFSFLSGCKHRVGFTYSHVREINHIFNNMYVDPGTEFISRYEKNHTLVEMFDVPKKATPPKINLSSSEKEEVDKFIGTFSRERFVTLHPGTSYRGRYKRWFPERFAEVADFVIEKYKVDVVLLFTPEEKAIADEILSKSHNKLYLSPKVNQRQLAYLIGRSKLYIGLDSGSMHVASLMQTPIVAIFGPSDVVQNKPADYAPFRIVYSDVDCAPCRNRTCEKRHCMESINAKDVISAIQELTEE